jgi:hypothetical protein
MDKLFIFAFLNYGLCNIIVHSHIFEKPRKLLLSLSPNVLGKLITCMMCFSVYSGFLFSFLIWNPLTILTSSEGLISNLLLSLASGLLSSGLVWFIHTLQEYFE